LKIKCLIQVAGNTAVFSSKELSKT